MKEKLKIWSKKWWFWVIVVFLVIIVFGSADNDDKGDGGKENNPPKSNKQEVVTFLEGTNSEDFISILSSVTGINGIEGVEIGDSITYSKSNGEYSISLDADKESKKIDYVSVICWTSKDPTNVFMAFNRMDYDGEDDAKLTDWLVSNIGKKAKIKIGNANFELSLGKSKHPVLSMKSDGSDAYMQEQTEKYSNQ